MGVRAEPRLLREPTPLENLSAAFQDLSTYVASTYHNYQASANARPSHVGPGGEDQVRSTNTSATSRTVTFATFDWYEWDEERNRRLCLLLGYADGFQMWDVEEPQEIREVVSVREDGWDNEAGCVVGIKVVPHRSDSEVKSPLCDVKGPILAVVTVKHRKPTAQQKESTDSSPPSASTSSNLSTSVISLFSLYEHRILRTREFHFDSRATRKKRIDSRGEVRFIRCNSRCIIVETAHPSSLHVFSFPHLESVGQFYDLAPPIHTPLSSSPNSIPGSATVHSYITPPGLNWSLGPRLLSYASTVDDGSQILDDVRMIDKRLTEGGIKVIKEVGEVGWGVVRTLGDFGYQKLSNYFASSPPSTSSSFPQHSTASASVPIPSPRKSNYSRSSPSVGGVGAGTRTTPSSTPGSFSPILSSSFGHQPSTFPLPPNDGAINDGSYSDDFEAGSTVGTVVIQDTFSLLCKSRSSDHHSEEPRNCRPVAHFRAHSNAITAISFNPSGTLLATASSGGHTINIYEFTGSQNAFSSIVPVSCPGTSPSTSLAHTHTATCSHSSMRHVFKLQRGYTSATIRDLTWSPDSQSLAATTSRGTVHIWGLGLSGSAGNIGSFPHNTPSSGATPPKSLSSVVRIRLKAAGGSGISSGYYPSTRNERNTGVDGAGAVVAGFMAEESRIDYETDGTTEDIQTHTPTIPNLDATFGPICHFLSPLSRTRIATDKHSISNRSTNNIQHDTRNDNITGSTTAASTRSRLRFPFRMPSTHPHLFSSLPLSSFGKTSETVTAYQEMYDWNPSGMLTMHRLRWDVGSAKEESEHERTIDRSDLALASVTSEDIAEWNLVRGEDWDEIRASVPEARKRRRTQSGGDTPTETRWLAHAEIVTHPPIYGHPLWKTIAFQVYTGTNPEKDSKTRHDGADHGLPPTKPLEIRRYVPKPYSCDENSGNEESGEGKVVGERGGALQEHISTAMGTDLEFQPTYQAVDLYATSRSGHSLSFEDAYLIQPKLVEHPDTFRHSMDTSSYGDDRSISQSSLPSSARTSFWNSSPKASSPWRTSRNKQKKDPRSLPTIRSKGNPNLNGDSATGATTLDCDDVELIDEVAFDDDEILFSHNRDQDSQIIVLDTDEMVDGEGKEKEKENGI